MLDPVPIRTLAVGCGTPVHPLSKLCQLAIEHLTSKEELPRNCKSTKDVLKVINGINENNAPLPDNTVLVLADIDKMYPNVTQKKVFNQCIEDYKLILLHWDYPLIPL